MKSITYIANMIEVYTDYTKNYKTTLSSGKQKL